MDILQNNPPYNGEDRTLRSSKELFSEVGATTLVVNQVVQDSSLGDKDGKLGWKPCNQ